MNRRHFLATAAALTGSGFLTLTGCGGGGGNGGGGAGLVSRRVLAQFPTGFALATADLVMEAGQSAVTPDTGGTFIVYAAPNDVPALAMLRDKAGRGVLMGFLPADGGSLTTRSAAVALLYYALGGFMLPEISRRPFVTLLEADAATVTLTGAIDRRIAANPYVLEGDDAEINAAVKVAYGILTAGGRVASFQKRNALTRAVEPILQVQPSGVQSNIEVVQGGATSVTVVNHSRRFCKVYAYRTGTPDPLPKALLQGSPIKLTSTTSLGVFSTINNLKSGQTAYVPVSSDPISLPLAPGSIKTLYEIIVIGASTNDLPRGFYSDAKYADEKAKWIQDHSDLSTQTWWQNLILPIFFEALGIAGLAATTSAVEGSLAAIQAIEAQSVKKLLLNASKGFLLQATGDFWMIAAENSLVGSQLRKALLPLYEAAVGQLAAETRATLFARLIVRAAVAAVVLIGTGDIAAVLFDTGAAQPAEQWFATVFQPTLILDPTAKTIAPGQRVTFSVKPPANLNGTVSYAWTQTGATSTLSSSDGVVGNSITTASTGVDLVTTASDSGTITVKVVATLTEPGGAKSELGTAQAVITIDSTKIDVKVPVTQQIYTVQSNTAGKFDVRGGYIVKVPQGAWVQAIAYNATGSAGTLARLDYNSGAPVINPDGTSNWIPYGYARNGNGKYYNLGDGTMFLLELHSGGETAAGDVQAASDAIKKALDAGLVDYVEFN